MKQIRLLVIMLVIMLISIGCQVNTENPEPEPPDPPEAPVIIVELLNENNQKVSGGPIGNTLTNELINVEANQTAKFENFSINQSVTIVFYGVNQSQPICKAITVAAGEQTVSFNVGSKEGRLAVSGNIVDIISREPVVDSEIIVEPQQQATAADSTNATLSKIIPANGAAWYQTGFDVPVTVSAQKQDYFFWPEKYEVSQEYGAEFEAYPAYSYDYSANIDTETDYAYNWVVSCDQKAFRAGYSDPIYSVNLPSDVYFQNFAITVIVDLDEDQLEEMRKGNHRPGKYDVTLLVNGDPAYMIQNGQPIYCLKDGKLKMAHPYVLLDPNDAFKITAFIPLKEEYLTSRADGLYSFTFVIGKARNTQ